MNAQTIAPEWVARLGDAPPDNAGDPLGLISDMHGLSDHWGTCAVGEILGLEGLTDDEQITIVEDTLPQKWYTFGIRFTGLLEDGAASKAAILLDEFAASLTESEYADALGAVLDVSGDL